MDGYHEKMIKEHAALIDRARRHPFMEKVAAGTIPESQFLDWLSQNYLWTRNFERFLANLGARAPKGLSRSFCEAMLNLHGEIELFEEISAKTDAKLVNGRMNFACAAYANFMTATVFTRTFGEGLVACYASNYAFREAWVHAKQTQSEPSRWQEFVDLWSQEGFKHWVDTLASLVDKCAETAPEESLPRMSETFRFAVMFSIKFWSSTMDGEDD